MARTALIVKTTRKNKQVKKAIEKGKKPKHITKNYNRCKLCGRNHGYFRRFGLCRICFRELARAGKVPGVTKCSW